jgi:hypothetical protein
METGNQKPVIRNWVIFFLLTGEIERDYKKICARIGPSWFFENIGGIGSPFPFFWGAQKKGGFQRISGFF